MRNLSAEEARAFYDHDVIDLYAERFDPVPRVRDLPNWLPDENAPDVAPPS
jgi:hypothetical protein